MNTHPLLAATDLSAPSRHACERAAMLARERGVPLVLVHALAGGALDELRRLLPAGAAAEATLEQHARAQLHALADALARQYGVAVEERLSRGHPVHEVARHADEADAALVVTGTRGAGFLRGVTVGSTAERIARRSQRPVLLGRQARPEPYRRVLVPVDFSGWSEPALALALALAPQASLVLMHAVEVPFEGQLHLAGVADHVVRQYRDVARREAQARLRALAQRSGVEAGRVSLSTPEGADPWMLALRQQEEQDCDLIVIGKHGRHALEELLLGSTTRMVMAEATVDVAVSMGQVSPP